MTEEDKKLIEAAEILKNHCKGKNRCAECVFSYEIPRQDMIYCRITCDCGVPSHWRIPKISRWTDADIALAKALIAFGSTRIHKNEIDNEAIYEKNGIFPCDSYVPGGAFRSLNKGETVMLKDIVAEGENYG